MHEELDREVDDGVGQLSLNRPGRRNAISEELFLQLREGVRAFGQDDGVRVIVLRSAVPGIFCAGADISTMADPRPAELERQFRLLTDCVEAFRAVPKPIVTVVQGDCLGAGCSLAAASDVVIAEAGARFALPEILLGLAPVLAMAALAPVVSMRSLVYWAATGRHVCADEARDGGLVTLVMPAADLEASVSALVSDLKRHSGAALGHVKRAAALLGSHSRDATPEALMQEMLATATHPAARGAITRFLERKRRV
jgi:enoyl-CoA hydratase/carnithine racemase